MAARAVFDVPDAFFCVFRADLVKLMFVTAVAGVAFEIAADMAGGTGSLVWPGQCEETRMFEARRFPCQFTYGAAQEVCLGIYKNNSEGREITFNGENHDIIALRPPQPRVFDHQPKSPARVPTQNQSPG